VSPEQARGKEIDWRSDLWALGIIVFECLTGRPPFQSEALGELMGMILYEPIPSLVAHDPKLPIALEKWWRRASAREPDQRFQSAKELADSLGQALGIEARLPIPDPPPLGLKTRAPARSRSPLPFAVPVGSVALVRRRSARAGRKLAHTYRRGRARRPRHGHERWLLPAGTAAVFAVVALSAFSAARSPEPLRADPSKLQISPALSAPAPRVAASARASMQVTPEVTPVTAPPTDAAPTSEPAPGVRARPPAAARSNREKPPRIRHAPRRASEHDAGKQGATKNDDSNPDYGI
jgi:serine/threonine-protein kinase